jgi:hypothetical protein
VVENIYNGVISIVAKEINFFKAVEREFLENANRKRLLYFSGRKGSPYKSTLSRSQMLNTINVQYKTQQEDPSTPVGEAESLKRKSLGATRWPSNKNFNMIEASAMQGKGRPREALEKDIMNATQFLSRIINEEQFLSRLGSYSVQNPDKYLPKSQQGTEELKIKDKDFREAINKRINSLQSVIRKAEEKRKKGQTVKKGSELRHFRMAKNIVEDLSAHSFLGRYAEALTPDFINGMLGFLTDTKKQGTGTAKLASEAYKHYNVVDTTLITLNVQEQPVIVGLSQKFKKHVDFRNTYQVYHDIYNVVNAFSGLGIKDNTLQSNSKFLIYLRKNLVTLNQ